VAIVDKVTFIAFGPIETGFFITSCWSPH